MRLRLTIAAAAACIAVAATSAHASYTLSASIATGATIPPFPLGDFGNAGINGLVSSAPVAFNGGLITFTPNASSPTSGVYDGSTINVATTPYNTTGLMARNYLVAEPGDPVNIIFNTAQSAFSLLWGSVDTYNSLTLQFLMGSTVVSTTTITGPQVALLDGFPSNGTTSAFVSITNSDPFTRVVAMATGSAFEFVPSVQVPEPASLAVLGASLIGVGIIRRRRTGKPG